MPTRFLINQCQIITFLFLKSDKENSRMKLRGIVLPVPSNQLKLHLFLFYPSTWYICDFFLFHIEIEGKGGWIIGGVGVGKGYVGPPPPLPTPMVGIWCKNDVVSMCPLDQLMVIQQRVRLVMWRRF